MVQNGLLYYFDITLKAYGLGEPKPFKLYVLKCGENYKINEKQAETVWVALRAEFATQFKTYTELMESAGATVAEEYKVVEVVAKDDNSDDQSKEEPA